MKKLTSLLLTLMMCLSLAVPAFASEAFSEAAPQEYSGAVGVPIFTIKDNESGEVQDIKATPEFVSRQTRSGETTITMGYSAFIPVPVPTTRTEEPGGKNENGVNVAWFVVYTISSSKEQIKVSRIYGSWTPSSHLYTVSDREVGLHAGLDLPGTLRKYPTSNTFDYSTGWGYVNFVTGSSAGSPYAWVDATISVYQMSGTYRLTSALAFPESR